ncbi:MAG: MFS transporter [Rikenellaceae bacterium]
MTKSVVLTEQSQKRIRLAVFLIFFFVGLCFSSWASRIPELKASLGLNDAEWGLMLLMIPMGQLAGMSFSGWIISRLGSNRILIVAVAGYALMLLGIGSFTSQYLFIASLILFGFFGNFCNIAMNTQAVIAENHYSRPIMASFHGGWSLAGLCGGLIGLVMTIKDIPIYIHFGVVCVIIIIGSMFQYRYLQYDAMPRKQQSQSNKKDKVPFENFLILFGIVGFTGWATEGTMADWNGIYLEEIVGIAGKYTPIGLVAYMITMTIGRFFMDRATARWGRRTILCACGAAIFSGMMLCVALPYPTTTIIGYMIVGFGACGVIPALYSAAGELTKMHTSRAITIVSTISFAGFLFGPPLIGYISQLTNLKCAFALIGILGLLAWILSANIKALRR